MTSVSEVTSRAVRVREFAAVMRESFARVFHYDVVSVSCSEDLPNSELMAVDG